MHHCYIAIRSYTYFTYIFVFLFLSDPGFLSTYYIDIQYKCVHHMLATSHTIMSESIDVH